MKPETFFNSTKAAAEVIDFVTILGIILFAFGMIGVVGYPLLQNVQEAKHIDNTKQSFQVMGNNINKIIQGQTPSQSIELKMYGEMLSVITNSSKESSISITLQNSSGITENLETYPMGVIEAEFDTATVAYEDSGAWAKYNSGGTVLISRPILVLKGENIFIPVTSIYGTASNGGEGLIRITGRGLNPVLIQRSNIKYISINIKSTYSKGWENEFKSNDWNIIGPGTADKNFTSPVNVYIVRRAVNVVIES